MIQIPKDFREFLQLLNENNVDFIIVGGYAVAFHGAPRYTGDIDIYVKREKENGKRIIAALEHFGFIDIGLKPEDFSEENKIFQLGYPPLRIDILTDIDGLSWGEALAGAVEYIIDDLTCKFIGEKELIFNKRKTGRHQDLADIDALEGKEQ
jgi:predicted nucleotidyltransferase